jgi:hypothetical protein
MNPRLVEELARQRHAEVVAKASKPRPAQHHGAHPRKHHGPSLRSSTGWAIVAIGLRIAESGRKHTAVATASHCR